MIRYGLLTANLLLLVAVIGFVVQSPRSRQANRQSTLTATNLNAANPLDQLSSSDIAVHLAQMASLPESTAVINQADTITGQMAISSADNNVAAKPQIVGTAAKSNRDIQKYVTQPGDTLAAVAAKFGVTSDSVRWSNDLTGSAFPVNRELFIPPVNGIVYLVKAGDQPDKLARDFSANKDAIIAFNDAEVAGLVVGQRIVVPDGTKATSVYNVTRYGGGLAWGSAPIYGFNGYDYGWCTWYVASRIPIPTNWGNANNWNEAARDSGWTVSEKPREGAIAQTDGNSRNRLGHVGIVEAVSADGTMIKYSDMNGLAGWGKRGNTWDDGGEGWVPALGKYQRFIYR